MQVFIYGAMQLASRSLTLRLFLDPAAPVRKKKLEISTEIESPSGFPPSTVPPPVLPLRFCGGKKEGLLPSSLGPPLGPRHIIGAAPSAMPGCCSPPTPAAGCLHRLGRSIVCIYVDGVNSGYNVSFPDFLESQITHFSSFRSYIYASSFPLKGALHYCNTSISTLAGPHPPHLVLRSQYATQCLIDEASTKAAPSSSSWSDLVLTWRMLVREGGSERASWPVSAGAKQTWLYLHLFPSLPSTISLSYSFHPAAAALITSSIIHDNCPCACAQV